MTRVLLTTVCQPLGLTHGDSHTVGYGLFEAQITHRQGIFGPRILQTQYGLSFIGANLGVPVVTLHYPTERQLVEELKRGYDLVGVSFVTALFHKMKATVALIRRHAPGAKVVLGGFGTTLGDETLAPHADLVCHGDGLAFLRELLGLPQVAPPFRHPILFEPYRILFARDAMFGAILAGQGCVNGCEFCSPSHFWGRKHLKLLPTGEEVYRVAEYYAGLHPRVKMLIFDEDFLADRQRGRGYLECVRREGRQFPLFCFASVQTLAQYTASELAEMGFEMLWIGYEGKRPYFVKRQGRDLHELVDDLRHHGVGVLASMIVGLPYQTEEILLEELEDVLSLETTFCQFMMYVPFKGTPYYDRLETEGRLLPAYRTDPGHYAWHATGGTAMMDHPHFTPERLEQLREHCYAEENRRLGPSIYRALDTYRQGYLHLKDSGNSLLRNRAGAYEKELLRSLSVFSVGKLFAPNRHVRERLATLHGKVIEALGRNPLPRRLLALLTPLAGLWASFCQKYALFEHPAGRRLEFDGSERDPVIPPRP